MATLAAAGLAGLSPPGRLILLDHPVFKFGALALGAGELFGDKLRSAPNRTAPMGMLARVLSAGVAGAALAPRGKGRAGAAVAIATAVPMAYATMAGRKRATAHFGQTAGGLIEDGLVVAAGLAVVFLAIGRGPQMRARL